MDINVIAMSILNGIGGKDNVTSLTYCATRLRFVLNDENKVDEAQVRQIESVKNIFQTRGQCQIVIGNETVKELYDALTALLKSDAAYLTKNAAVASAILEALGGAGNLASLAYCATRLRLELHDNNKIAADKVAKIAEVSASFMTRGQYQLVLGNEQVKGVYEEMAAQVKEPVSGEMRQYSRLKQAAKSLLGKG